MTTVLAMSSSAGSVSQLITVILIFALVLFVTVYTTKLVGSFQKMQGVNRNMEVIETLRIANNKYLQIVRAGNKYFVIGVGKEEVSMLVEVGEDELIKLNSDKSNMKESFADIMSKAGISVRKGNDKSNNNE